MHDGRPKTCRVMSELYLLRCSYVLSFVIRHCKTMLSCPSRLVKSFLLLGLFAEDLLASLVWCRPSKARYIASSGPSSSPLSLLLRTQIPVHQQSSESSSPHVPSHTHHTPSSLRDSPKCTAGILYSPPAPYPRTPLPPAHRASQNRRYLQAPRTTPRRARRSPARRASCRARLARDRDAGGVDRSGTAACHAGSAAISFDHT